MRRSFVFGWCVPSAIVLGTLLAPLTASATDVQACLGASEKGQRARSAGKLREARDQFLVCGAEVCPALVRRDCTQWQAEVMSTLPTVVLGAKDKQGRDLFDVTVSMDGETLTKKLDGKSVPIDPGPHTFKFEVVGAAPVTERALVKEGEKTRVISVKFGDAASDTPAGESGTPPPPDGDHGKTNERGHTVLPWIVVGAGVATVAVGIVLIVTSPALPDACNKSTQTCVKIAGESADAFANRQNEAGRSDAQPKEGLIVGAVGLVVIGGGLLWHFLEPTGPEKTGALRFTPWAAPGVAGGAFGLRF